MNHGEHRGHRAVLWSSVLSVVSVVWVILAAGAAEAQILIPEETPSATHTVSGSILLDRTGFPKERLLVRLSTSSGMGGPEEFADSSGRFEFKNVPAGEYVVTVRAPADSLFEDGTAKIRIYKSSDSRNYSVNVTLPLRKSVVTTTHAPGTVTADPDAAVPKKARDAYRRGVDAAGKGKGDEAVEKFREALGLAPDYRAALNDLGVELLKLDRSTEALPPLRRAVELGPDAFAPRLNLTLALLATDDLEGATASAARALELRSDSSRALCAAGQIALRRGNTLDAVAYLRRALDAGDEMQAAAAFWLGRAHETAGDVASAVEAYRRVTYLEPTGSRSDEAHARLKALGAE